MRKAGKTEKPLTWNGRRKHSTAAKTEKPLTWRNPSPPELSRWEKPFTFWRRGSPKGETPHPFERPGIRDAQRTKTKKPLTLVLGSSEGETPHLCAPGPNRNPSPFSQAPVSSARKENPLTFAPWAAQEKTLTVWVQVCTSSIL